MDFLANFEKTSQLFSSCVSKFQKTCELYKFMLDKNYGGRFCIGEYCKTIFMVEIKFDGCKWGATPNTFYSEEEAQKEVEALKIKYPFISEFRVVARKEKEKD